MKKSSPNTKSQINTQTLSVCIVVLLLFIGAVSVSADFPVFLHKDYSKPDNDPPVTIDGLFAKAILTACYKPGDRALFKLRSPVIIKAKWNSRSEGVDSIISESDGLNLDSTPITISNNVPLTDSVLLKLNIIIGDNHTNYHKAFTKAVKDLSTYDINYAGYTIAPARMTVCSLILNVKTETEQKQFWSTAPLPDSPSALLTTCEFKVPRAIYEQYVQKRSVLTCFLRTYTAGQPPTVTDVLKEAFFQANQSDFLDTQCVGGLVKLPVDRVRIFECGFKVDYAPVIAAQIKPASVALKLLGQTVTEKTIVPGGGDPQMSGEAIPAGIPIPRDQTNSIVFQLDFSPPNAQQLWDIVRQGSRDSIAIPPPTRRPDSSIKSWGRGLNVTGLAKDPGFRQGTHDFSLKSFKFQWIYEAPWFEIDSIQTQ